MKVLVVGGEIERPEMEKAGIGLEETGHKVTYHQFEGVDGTSDDASDLVKRIKSEKPGIIFTRKNYYPKARDSGVRDQIGTSFIPEHLLGLGIPVIGCDAERIRLLRHKTKCDIAIGDAGLPYTNNFILVNPGKSGRPYGKVVNQRGFAGVLQNPFEMYDVLFIKPNSGGRSVGITDANVVHNLDELIARTGELADELKGSFLTVTPFYHGREFTVGMVGNGQEDDITLPVEVCQVDGYSETGIIQQGVKHGGIPEGRVYIQPLEDLTIVNGLDVAARKIQEALGITDYTRIDFRRDPATGEFKAIDINGVPGIKYMESYMSMAAENAFDAPEGGPSVYARLVSSIVSTAADRFGILDKKYPTLFGLPNKLFIGGDS